MVPRWRSSHRFRGVDVGFFRIEAEPFDVAALRRSLAASSAGGYVSFEGWVRDNHDGRSVSGLSYESYAVLATAEGSVLVDQAISRFDIIDAGCVHRVGALDLGELAVWVGVSSAHRGAAFDACRWIIDEVKLRLPIWKHERYSQGDGQWLHPLPASH